ncbi:hypothetical protein WA158_001162 [Blastocystis sp. Blastoise]
MANVHIDGYLSPTNNTPLVNDLTPDLPTVNEEDDEELAPISEDSESESSQDQVPTPLRGSDAVSASISEDKTEKVSPIHEPPQTSDLPSGINEPTPPSHSLIAPPQLRQGSLSPMGRSTMLSFRTMSSLTKNGRNSISMQRLSRVPQRMSRTIPRDMIHTPVSLYELRQSANVSASYSNRILSSFSNEPSYHLKESSLDRKTASTHSMTPETLSPPPSHVSVSQTVTPDNSTSTLGISKEPTPDRGSMSVAKNDWKVPIAKPDTNKEKFPANVYITAKYTLWNFIPYNLYEQFRRFANFVFLLMVFIQLIPGVSPFPLYTTLAPLVFILAVSAIKEAIEDFSRHKLDNKTNSALYQRVEPDGSTTAIPSRDICAGDILILSDNDSLPCDMLLLSCADQDGICYVDTAGLDGETNLKEKSAPKLTRMFQQTDELDSLSNLKGVFLCEQPNKNLNSFTGTLYVDIQTGIKARQLDPTISLTNGEGDYSKYFFSSVDIDAMLLRGSCIKNSGWVAGMAVYTGDVTKLSLNLCESSFKFSKVEKKMNKYVPIVFILWLIMSIVSAIIGYCYSSNPFLLSLGISQSNGISGFLLDFCTFFVLYSFCVPMSLYVGLEFSRWVQAFYMSNDLDMFEEGEGAMRVGTSNLNDELGQIDFILSDKTGTITRNEMVYYGFSVGGLLFTREMKDIDLPIYMHDDLDREIFKKFMRVLCVVNTVKPVQDEDEIIYRAESADEEALMIGVSQFGWSIINRTKDSVDIEEGSLIRRDITETFASPCEIDPPIFELLYCLPFTSARKRMTYIVRDREGEISVYSKGADSKICEFSCDAAIFNNTYIPSQLNERQKRLLKTVDHVQSMSKDGYRLLLVAGRVLTDAEYNAWTKIYNKAAESIENRDELIESAFEQIEKGIEIYGCTAVEDRLQEHIHETISSLRQAGIRVCVATGDKMETAENIAYNTGLIDRGMPVYHISCHGDKHILHHQLQQVIQSGHYKAPRSSVIFSSRRLTVKENTPISISSSPSNIEGIEISNNNNNKSIDKGIKNTVINGVTIHENTSIDIDMSSKIKKESKFISSMKSLWSQLCENIRLLFIKKENPRKRKLKLDKERGSVPPYSVIIDGESVDMIIHYYKDEFEYIVNSCSTMVCCRMSPKQKSKVICFAKETGNVTLAIGDGANDISMIRDGNVGVGIWGKEGTGAANSADYVIRRFHHLRKLLFVHGRNCLKGTSYLILEAFFCNMAFNFPQLFYLFSSLGSGQAIYSSTALTAFVMFAAPFFGSFGFFYTELKSQTLMNNPSLYKALHTGRSFFSTEQYILILCSAFICSLFAYMIPHYYFSVDDSTLSDGTNLDIYSLGFNSVIPSGIQLMIPLVCTYVMPDELYYSLPYVSRSPFLWLQIVFMFGLQFVPRLAIKGLQIAFKPEDYQVCIEREYLEEKNKKSSSSTSASFDISASNSVSPMHLNGPNMLYYYNYIIILLIYYFIHLSCRTDCPSIEMVTI